MERDGRVDERLLTVSIALDGGIGLSGGSCGALAAAVMLLGTALATDPRRGFASTLAPFARGYLNMLPGRDEPELWSIGSRLLSDFRNAFGSLECRAITGFEVRTPRELERHVSGSSTCGEITRWVAERLRGLPGLLRGQ